MDIRRRDINYLKEIKRNQFFGVRRPFGKKVQIIQYYKTELYKMIKNSKIDTIVVWLTIKPDMRTIRLA